ncbi:MAG: Lrp/AsnC family transcriptional regulator [Candidatus Hodarchaeales archaeon]|jgi:DNA-binding Lrp family transcriptional regulator
MTKDKKIKQELDEIDISILQELQKDSRTSLQELSKRLNQPSSTIHYRLKRLEEQKFIDGFYVKINPEKLDINYLTIILVRAVYESKYYDRIGDQIKKIPGVWACYFILGEWDFVVHCRSKDRQSYLKILDQLMEIKGIERTSSQVVAKVLKEDPRLDLNGENSP